MSATNRGAERIAHDIPGWSGYQVTRDGRVLSFKRLGPYLKGPRELAQGRDRDGYVTVQVTENRRSTVLHVHKLVCAAFNGPKPSPTHEVRHLDGNKDNNRAENLAWGTPLENSADRERHGRTARGIRQPQAKLTDDNVREIRRRLADGETHKAIAATFGVSYGKIGHIASGRNWRHVS